MNTFKLSGLKSHPMKRSRIAHSFNLRLLFSSTLVFNLDPHLGPQLGHRPKPLKIDGMDLLYGPTYLVAGSDFRLD